MARRSNWLEKTAALLYVVFCFELGVFLIVFPWLKLWEYSFFSNLGFSLMGQTWEYVWDSAWFRGAISGLGVVNIVISLIEVSRLRGGTSEESNDRESSRRSELQ